MADHDSQQRSSTSLFGQSSSSQSIQDLMRERQEASRARRKWLFSWLLPLIGGIVVIGLAIFGVLEWRQIADEKRQEALREASKNDPMRGVTVFGNEEAALQLEVTIGDSMMAPRELMIPLHRAVGIKPFKVCLKVVDMSLKAGMDEGLNTSPSVKINGNQKVEYLDASGQRQSIDLKYPGFTTDQLIAALTLAYQEAYPDEDPAHPFHIDPLPKEENRARQKRDEIDLMVDRLVPKK